MPARNILHRRIHLDDVPDYLAHGASKQLLLHRSRSPTLIPDDDHQSGYFTVQREEELEQSRRRYSARRSRPDQWTISDQRQMITERMIPVDHQRAAVIRESEQPMVKVAFHFYSHDSI